MFPGGNAHAEHPHPGAPPEAKPRRLTGWTRYLRPIPTRLRHPTMPPQRTSPPSCPRRLESQPATLPAAHARYTLKTSRPPPKGLRHFLRLRKEARVSGGRVCGGVAGFCAVLARYCTEGERQGGEEWGRLDGKGGRGWFRERVEAVEKKLTSAFDTHGIAALAIRDGRAHKPGHQATYFDGDWEGTVNKHTHAHWSPLPYTFPCLPAVRSDLRTVLVLSPLRPPTDFSPCDPPTLAQALTLSDSTPFTLSPRAPEHSLRSRKETTCVAPRGAWAGWGTFLVSCFLFSVLYGRWDGTGRVPPSSCFARIQPLLFKVAVGHARRPVLVSASSAEFTTDLVPVLSMTKLADASVSGGARGVSGAEGGAGSYFTDVLVPEEVLRSHWIGVGTSAAVISGDEFPVASSAATLRQVLSATTACQRNLRKFYQPNFKISGTAGESVRARDACEGNTQLSMERVYKRQEMKGNHGSGYGESTSAE
ncbi:hypothetical protein B0H13DRAFT_2273988 [Mycena leptocephala]|nr:hypothetical protein B0H13DRAFT_2273988 [Mycena leptocephala]